MSAEPARYRIRGLAEPEVKPPAPVPEKKTFREVPLSEFRPRPSLDVALMAIGRPKLSDFIHRASVDRLKAWWPTFDFLSRQWGPRPVKSHPVALGPYLPDSRALRTTPELKVIEEYWKIQIEETDNINRVLTVAEDMTLAPPPLNSVDTPVATALLCALFRGSTWVKRHEVKFQEIIGRNPVAAYIMVQLGRPDQRESFASQILRDPHLVLDLCIEGRFGHLISPDSLPNVFEKMPHLLPLARFARLELNEPYAWNALMEIAASDPLAAAFALGLHPTNEGAKEWHALVALNPEAIYWALRVWTKHQHQASEFPYWLEYQTLIKKDVRWFYHWCRDIDQTEARNAVRWHWPNPWAVELIVDLQLESDLVRELCQASFKNIDNDDPWTSTLVLWAAEFIQAKGENKNETSQDD